MQANLVSIKDRKVGDFLHNIFRKKAWIGAKRDKDNKSQFYWADNTPVKYTSWLSGEPNNVNEGCVINNWNGNKEWIDASCELGPEVPDSNVPAGFFCEMDTAASVLKGDVGEWTQNGHPKNAWQVKNVLKKGENEQEGKDGIFNYWLLPNGAKNKGFTLDLGILKALNLVKVVNTHTSHWRDRATKKFKVYVR